MLNKRALLAFRTAIEKVPGLIPGLYQSKENVCAAGALGVDVGFPYETWVLDSHLSSQYRDDLATAGHFDRWTIDQVINCNDRFVFMSDDISASIVRKALVLAYIENQLAIIAEHEAAEPIGPRELVPV